MFFVSCKEFWEKQLSLKINKHIYRHERTYTNQVGEHKISCYQTLQDIWASLLSLHRVGERQCNMLKRLKPIEALLSQQGSNQIKGFRNNS